MAPNHTGKLSPEQLKTFAGYLSEAMKDPWIAPRIDGPKRPCRRCGDFCGQEKPHHQDCEMMAVSDACTCPT